MHRAIAHPATPPRDGYRLFAHGFWLVALVLSFGLYGCAGDTGGPAAGEGAGDPAATDVGETALPIVNGQISYEFSGTGGLTNAQGRLFCSASLVRPQWVLTAAHCLDDAGQPTSASPAPSPYFVLGLVPGAPAIRRQLTEVVLHPGYDADAVTNDLALARLDQPITEVAPVAVSAAPPDTWTGLAVELVGYGVSVPSFDQAFARGSGVRRRARVMVQGLTRSTWYYDFGRDRAGSCWGDSGGPAFAVVDGRFQQVGVTSFGLGLACSGQGHYTRLDLHRAWLTRMGVPLSGGSEICERDGVCNGACYSDDDCLAALYPPGVGVENGSGCRATEVRAASDGSCRYLNGSGQECARFSAVYWSRFDRSQLRCLYTDALGNVCRARFPRCGFTGCSCPTLEP